MADNGHKVGGEVDSICGKCKMETRHVIVAMVDSTPKKVQCLSCKSQHNYRPLKAVKAKSTSPKKPRATSSRRSLNEEDAVDYRIDGCYDVDAVLRHSKFGLGLIKSVQQGRVTVDFQGTLRMLIIRPPSE